MSTPIPEEMLNGPALPPPENVIPNFDNPPNQNVYAMATFVICLFFGTAGTAIRLYSKAFLVKSAHLGDCEYIFTETRTCQTRDFNAGFGSAMVPLWLYFLASQH